MLGWENFINAFTCTMNPLAIDLHTQLRHAHEETHEGDSLGLKKKIAVALIYSRMLIAIDQDASSPFIGQLIQGSILHFTIQSHQT